MSSPLPSSIPSLSSHSTYTTPSISSHPFFLQITSLIPHSVTTSLVSSASHLPSHKPLALTNSATDSISPNFTYNSSPHLSSSPPPISLTIPILPRPPTINNHPMLTRFKTSTLPLSFSAVTSSNSLQPAHSHSQQPWLHPTQLFNSSLVSS
ncbi:hypothetical protein U1Q18_003115 [Sarracenia purpurea var. burkii]